MLFGGMEGGGTKFVCAVGDQTGHLVDQVSFPTEEPDETLREAKRFFTSYSIEALGVGSFGPIDLNRDDTTYGMILNTPKLAWRNYPLLEKLNMDYDKPVFINTDVNVACLGEYTYGASRDVASALYMTVGTGIGAGFVQNGMIYQGNNHSEMGHIFVNRYTGDSFIGSCPSHGDCLEGLASGTSITERYGKQGVFLADDQKVWELEAYYLAQALVTYTMILSPQRIMLGGGVMKQENLLDLIREQFMQMLNGYLSIPDVQAFIVKPELDDEQGVKGAIQLAMDGLEE